MFIETSSPRTSGDVAILESTWLNNVAETCTLRFWYHMYGQNIDTLEVYSKSELGVKMDLWSLKGQQVTSRLLLEYYRFCKSRVLVYLSSHD